MLQFPDNPLVPASIGVEKETMDSSEADVVCHLTGCSQAKHTSFYGTLFWHFMSYRHIPCSDITCDR